MDLARLRTDLYRDEGKKLDAYRDTRGFWTIGCGHLLGGSPRMSSITGRECDALLNIDIEDALAATIRVFPFAEMLDDVRLRAIVNMTFNRGEERMRRSETIGPAIRTARMTGDWVPVDSAIMASPWAAEVGDRAVRLAHMLVTGTDPA